MDSPADTEAALPITVIRSRCPRILTLSTQKPDCSLWKVTRSTENVTQGARFIAYIKSFREPVFSDAGVEVVLRRIAGGRLKPGAATNRAHVRSLETRADPLAERRCPKCGGALILRTAKKGPRSGDRFWGCSTYPQCRVMQPLG